MEGYVYLLINPAFKEDIVKIGKTKNIEQRLKQLYNTSTPFPFECVYAIKCPDMDSTERNLHDLFCDERVNPDREYFRVDSDKVIKAMKLTGYENVTPGVETLESALEPLLSKNNVYFLRKNECYAVAEEVNGKFIVKKGSIVSKASTASFSKYSDSNKREIFLKENVDENLKLIRDVEFNSPSLASALILGARGSGPMLWKLEDGRTYKQVHEELN